MNTIRSRPIAIIDSGLGGLTVASALRQTLPMEDLIYFGDTAACPTAPNPPPPLPALSGRLYGFCCPLIQNMS